MNKLAFIFFSCFWLFFACNKGGSSSQENQELSTEHSGEKDQDSQVSQQKRLSRAVDRKTYTDEEIDGKEFPFRACSAYKLSGKTLVVVAFIGEKAWTKKEKDVRMNLLLEAQQWICEQASDYGKKVSFENVLLGYDNSIIYDHIESGSGSGNESPYIINEFAQKIGYASSLEMYEQYKDSHTFDNFLVLLIADKNGRGYALPGAKVHEGTEFFVEGVLLYTHYLDGSDESRSSSYAHEILHTFGAQDLYETFQTTIQAEKYAKKKYPEDIMLSASYDITDHVIDLPTAWMVGLSVYQPDFDQFVPQNGF